MSNPWPNKPPRFYADYILTNPKKKDAAIERMKEIEPLWICNWVMDYLNDEIKGMKDEY